LKRLRFGYKISELSLKLRDKSYVNKDMQYTNIRAVILYGLGTLY
jgi:hypothetical protein